MLNRIIRFSPGAELTECTVGFYDPVTMALFDEITTLPPLQHNVYVVEVPDTISAGLVEAHLLDDLGNSVDTAFFYWTGEYVISETAYQVATLMIDGGINLNDALKIILASTSGRSSIAGNQIAFKSVDGTQNRIVATTTADGQRTNITLNTDV